MATLPVVEPALADDQTGAQVGDHAAAARCINVEATVKLAQALTIPVIASGGLKGISDIEALCQVAGEGIEGVICGRAIYTGDLDLSSAQARADEWVAAKA